MASIYARGKRLYAKVKNAAGKWTPVKTEYFVGEEALAERFARELQRLEDAKRPASSSGIPTLATYTEEWLAGRKDLVSVNDDATRLRLHVLPELGSYRLDELRPRHIRDLVLALKDEGRLAPRSIRKVYGVLHVLLHTAVADEKIAVTPCVLRRGILPKNKDKTPGWRQTAVFTREELQRLISDEAVIADRRVLVALKGLAALRHSEAAGLRWSDYESEPEPLGRLRILDTKSEADRLVPVHSALAKLLDSWKRKGWESVFGRAPTSADLIVPTRAMTVRDATESQRQFHDDLRRLGLRLRRGHDLRRTFISLARTDGANPDMLKVITHGVSTEILDVYSSFAWSDLCREVLKLQVLPGAPPILKTGKSVELDRVPTEKRRRARRTLVTSLVQVSASAQRRWANAAADKTKPLPVIREGLASPTGVEPVLQP